MKNDLDRHLACFLISSLLLTLSALVPASAQTNSPRLKLETKETLLCKVPFTVNPATTVTSPDERHIAFVVPRAGKKSVARDGVEGPRYDAVTNLTFSPDSQHLAYLGRRGEDRFIVLDGKEGKHYDAFAGPLDFSPDSRRLAACAVLSEQYLLIINGEQVSTNEGVARFQRESADNPEASPVEHLLAFSPDSQHVAYCVKAGEKMAVVRDRYKEREYDQLGSPPVFSFDSQHLAYAAKRGSNCMAVLDGKEGAAYDNVGVVRFSPDGRLVYFGQRAGKHFLVVGGEEGMPYENVGTQIAWSADGHRFAYRADRGDHSFAVIDGKESELLFDKRRVGGFGFSPNGSSVAYTAARANDQWMLIVDGKMGRFWDGFQVSGYSPLGDAEFKWFSPDGRLVYVAGKRDKLHLVIGGEPGKPYDALGTVAFSPDGKHVAAAAALEKNFFVVVDGVEGKSWPLASFVPGLPRVVFDNSTNLYYLAWRTDEAFDIAVFRVEAQIIE